MITEVLQPLSADINALLSDERYRPQTPQELLEEHNMLEGNLIGYDCPLCKNKGYILSLDEMNREVSRECSCVAIRNNLERIRKSGLEKVIERLTFESYKTVETWQENFKCKAEAFLGEPDGMFFFMGGQSGAGKTHLCTAISGEMLKNGRQLVYITWAQELQSILGLSENGARQEREKKLSTLQKAKVLYIDDFMRGEKPTQAEKKLAFEIINYRYMNSLTTIISSEKIITQLSDVDEAIAGRIFEKAGGFDKYVINIKKDIGHNYRCSKMIS